MKKAFAASIAKLDLDPHGFKLGIEYGWPLEKIDEALFYYRCFLQAILDSPDTPVVPSKEIDEVWHQHILDTEKYMTDCQEVFGRYVHHFPYSGLRGEEDARIQAERFTMSQIMIREIADSNV